LEGVRVVDARLALLVDKVELALLVILVAVGIQR
jgi:hypothetical protein